MVSELEIQEALDGFDPDEIERLFDAGGYGALRLAGLMSHHSEEIFCAQWMMGLEHNLHETIEGGDRTGGCRAVNEEDREQLREARDLAEGWIYWDEKEDGLRLVSRCEWERMHRLWKGEGCH